MEPLSHLEESVKECSSVKTAKVRMHVLSMPVSQAPPEDHLIFHGCSTVCYLLQAEPYGVMVLYGNLQNFFCVDEDKNAFCPIRKDNPKILLVLVKHQSVWCLT